MSDLLAATHRGCRGNPEEAGRDVGPIMSLMSFAPMHGVPSLCMHCSHSEESHDELEACPGPGLLARARAS